MISENVTNIERKVTLNQALNRPKYRNKPNIMAVVTI